MTDQQNIDQIKVGIAGLGRSGWGIHANALSHMPEHFQVVAVCDPDSARQQEAQDRFGCRTYADYPDLVADDEIELMIVATPSQLHVDDTIAAMEAGKDVLVEKPMAKDLAGVDQMIAAANDMGRILTVNQNYRYAPDFLKIKAVIASGVLGRIIQIKLSIHQFRRRWDWQTLKKYGGGILNNHGAHFVDWALLLIDDPEPDVFCHMETTPLTTGDTESHVKIVLKPKEGPIADIELTHACAYPQDHCQVMGTQGGLSSNRRTIRWKYFDPATVPPLVLDIKPTSDRSYNNENLPMQEETFTPVNNFILNMKNFYGDLYATLREGAPLAITPESVRRQILVLERCRELSPV